MESLILPETHTARIELVLFPTSGLSLVRRRPKADSAGTVATASLPGRRGSKDAATQHGCNGGPDGHFCRLYFACRLARRGRGSCISLAPREELHPGNISSGQLACLLGAARAVPT